MKKILTLILAMLFVLSSSCFAIEKDFAYENFITKSALSLMNLTAAVR
ncbi:MAG: hypothetical protein WCX81_05905 [Monoglobales bacterium]